MSVINFKDRPIDLLNPVFIKLTKKDDRWWLYGSGRGGPGYKLCFAKNAKSPMKYSYYFSAGLLSKQTHAFLHLPLTEEAYFVGDGGACSKVCLEIDYYYHEKLGSIWSEVEGSTPYTRGLLDTLSGGK